MTNNPNDDIDFAAQARAIMAAHPAPAPDALLENDFAKLGAAQGWSVEQITEGLDTTYDLLPGEADEIARWAVRERQDIDLRDTEDELTEGG